MSFGSVPKPVAPPSSPISANASVREAGSRQSGNMGYKSFIATSPNGLTRKDKTKKSSVIGGA